MTKTVGVVIGKEYKVKIVGFAMEGFSVGDIVMVLRTDSGHYSHHITKVGTFLTGYADAGNLEEIAPDLLDESKVHVLTETGSCLQGFNAGDKVNVKLMNRTTHLSSVASYEVTKESNAGTARGFAPIENLEPVEETVSVEESEVGQDETFTVDTYMTFLTELAKIVEDETDGTLSEDNPDKIKAGDIVKVVEIDESDSYVGITEGMELLVTDVSNSGSHIWVKVSESKPKYCLIAEQVTKIADTAFKADTISVGAISADKVSVKDLITDFKTGDTVKILSVDDGDRHLNDIKVGDVYTVVKAPVVFDEQLVEIKLYGSRTYNVWSSQVELVKPETAVTFKVGDFVKGTEDSPYSITDENMIKGEVISVSDTHVTVRVLELAESTFGLNETFTVLPKYFEKIVSEVADFPVGSTVMLHSGGGKHPLQGFENGKEYKVETAVGFIVGAERVTLSNGSYHGYALPENLTLVAAANPEPEPKYEAISFLEAMKIIADNGTVYTLEVEDGYEPVDRYTDLDSVDYCSDLDDLIYFTDWYKKA